MPILRGKTMHFVRKNQVGGIKEKRKPQIYNEIRKRSYFPFFRTERRVRDRHWPFSWVKENQNVSKIGRFVTINISLTNTKIPHTSHTHAGEIYRHSVVA